MNTDLSIPFADFLFAHLADYTATQLPAGTKLSGRLWKEQVARAHEAWHGYRKPRKQPKVISSEADAIYQIYPRHVGREAAKRAILKALEKIPGDVLADRVRAYAAATARWQKDDQQFVPHCSTWMNEGRYDDDVLFWERHNSKPVSKPQLLQREPNNWLPFMLSRYPDWCETTDGRRPTWTELSKASRDTVSSLIPSENKR